MKEDELLNQIHQINSLMKEIVKKIVLIFDQGQENIDKKAVLVNNHIFSVHYEYKFSRQNNIIL